MKSISVLDYFRDELSTIRKYHRSVYDCYATRKTEYKKRLDDEKQKLKHKKNTVIINYGRHFEARLVERFKVKSNIQDYLNKHLSEGYMISEHKIFFVEARVLVPIVSDRIKINELFAKTFMFGMYKINHNHKQYIKQIEWKRSI
ncbi:MAG: hypothetical protein OIN86_13190 [Candidatus Methanoperedens sp.]|nr:hypothetical protein [Candidatus Methanoperedens sp.]CAG0949284.1 hypothetical protein METP1_00095 [Methanosarcinales archaeon]